MAIARDAHSNAIGDTSAVTSVTWTHTCSGSNRILFVAAYAESGNTVTGITYSGVSMTLAKSVNLGGLTVYIYVLVAPATGANGVVIHYSGTSGLKFGMAASYTGANQTGQPDASNSSAHTPSTSESLSLTTIANNAWIFGLFVDDNAGTFSGTGAFSVLYQGTGGPTSAGGWNGFSILDTNGPITPAGATTVGVSSTAAAADTMLVAVSFAPVAATPSTTPLRTLMGAGV